MQQGDKGLNTNDVSLAGSWMQVVVARKKAVADDVMCFELRSPHGAQLPAFTAGAHINVELPNGMVRQYSLCNSPLEQERYQVGVLLAPAGRGGSRSAHADLETGDSVRISRPRNHFALVPALHTILLGGGIGVTPLLSMAEHLTQTNASFELHLCTRSKQRTAFLDRLKEAAYAHRVHFHFDDGPPSQRLAAELLLSNAAQGSHVYVCGPSGFMDHVIQTAQALSWAQDRIHFEFFSAMPVVQGQDLSFELQWAPTGQVVTVSADQTAAQALEANGIKVSLSCEQGICGSCTMRVLEGVPEHRDLFFSDEERAANNRFTPCCSRALSRRLVIDI
jgi:vanillate O-demethylase ferredoxin subunit